MSSNIKSTGITPIMTTVLLLMIAIILIGVAYIFFTRIFNISTTSTQGGVESTVGQAQARFIVDNIDTGNGVIYIRNLGNTSLSQFTVYVNGQQWDATSGTIQPGSTGALQLSSALPEGMDKLKITTQQGIFYVEETVDVPQTWVASSEKTSMQDFWDGKAFFEFQNFFSTLSPGYAKNFTLGSSAPAASGFYGSFDGQLSYVSLFNYPTINLTPSILQANENQDNFTLSISTPLDFNGQNSVFEISGVPTFELKDKMTLKIRLLIRSMPSSKSAFIAGKLGHYWLELYQDGNLCFWINTNIGNKNACTKILTNQWYDIDAIYQAPYIAIYNNGATTEIINTSSGELDRHLAAGGNDIVVRGDTWYWFSNEVYSPKPPYCPAGMNRVVVWKSMDKGHTWANRTVIIEPKEGTPYECMAVDGDVYFDETSNTWQHVFQCYARDGKWNLCHELRQGVDPLGTFVDNPSNPVVHGGDLWSKICLPGSDCYTIDNISQGNKIVDEGTPEIVEKRGDYFYVTFHGYDYNTQYGFRGIARTKDFINWELVNNDAIFDKYNCMNWNVNYDSNGCIGGGAASILKDRNYYYMIIEAPDKSLGCAKPVQQWPFGIVRSLTLESTKWENMANNESAIIFKSKDATEPCTGPAYDRLFKGIDSTEYLLILKMTGFESRIYLYKLSNSTPLASYYFREGPLHNYTDSDIITRYNAEAKVSNATWLSGGTDGSYILDFNGQNSVVEMPNIPLFDIKNNLTLKLRLLIRNMPTSKSAFIAGKLGSYWLELYPNSNLCFWVNTNIGYKNACTQISTNQWYDIDAIYDTTSLKIYKNSIPTITNISSQELMQTQNIFKLGSTAPDANGFYSSFDGQLDYIKLYNFATIKISG